ncbi:MAG: hypothetical protein BACD_01979 [Bacteroides rodentium]
MRGLSPNWLLGTETLHLYIRSEFVNQEDSHELTDEYIILFQGITKAIEECQQIGKKLERLKEEMKEKQNL